MASLRLMSAFKCRFMVRIWRGILSWVSVHCFDAETRPWFRSPFPKKKYSTTSSPMSRTFMLPSKIGEEAC